MIDSLLECSVLVVDDEPESLQLLSRILKRRGIMPRPVASGRLAIEAAEADPPDLVLMDVWMPEMSGLEACRRFKRHDRLRDIPIIFISGAREIEDKVEAFRAGGIDFVSKPFQEDEVLARIETHIHLQQLRAELLSQNQQLEIELRHAQKMQAVGQLASGIAHEINTPTQFVGDSLHFVREVLEGMARLLPQYRNAVTALHALQPDHPIALRIQGEEEQVDLGYLMDNAPEAVDRCFEGLTRIEAIVRSMKEFAHIDQRDKSLADINQALCATLIIAKNEYKYVADVESCLGELPPVLCHIGDLNQVFLNLIVNAAHAIGDVVKASGGKGKIRVRTQHEGDRVVVEIEDTGGGIPEKVRDRIFDPFFTTKPIGKGSGQGLAISRRIVVDRHGGTLSFRTEMGAGTTFRIELPVAGGGSPSPS